MEVIKKVKLSEIAEVITKGTTPTTLGYEFQPSGVNFLKIECFDENGLFIKEKVTHISEECNEKLDTYRDENLDLPKRINDANKNLMLMTMEACYEDIQENHKQIQEITEWINNIRVELKKNMVRKEEMQRRNQDLYAYMHDIFGADVIELFDMKFGVDNKDS